eukprot:gnl/TRDRNA2_/TRDRNA2_42685_c0_seq1.p1 gnl/TRDRNA2_/TRDRNA2_42685_c0~~gnl/TRDRNA2_/TRDRNA2_42685_c0_seq1.p1  ORF type:complete len:760 (+),score=132.73 gnl/TRDRNA2_/TRDRNA2_42685_c0_seq1:251-2281(+)
MATELAVRDVEIASLEVQLREVRADAVHAMERLWAHSDKHCTGTPLVGEPPEPAPDSSADISAQLCSWLQLAQRLPQPELRKKAANAAANKAELLAKLELSSGADCRQHGRAAGRIARPQARTDGGATAQRSSGVARGNASLSNLREQHTTEMSRKIAELNVRVAKSREVEMENLALKRIVQALENKAIEDERRRHALQLQFDRSQRALVRMREAGHDAAAAGAAAAIVDVPSEDTQPREVVDVGVSTTVSLPAEIVIPVELLTEISEALRNLNQQGLLNQASSEPAAGAPGHTNDDTCASGECSSVYMSPSSSFRLMPSDRSVGEDEALEARVREVQNRCASEWCSGAVRSARLKVERDAGEPVLRLGGSQRRLKLLGHDKDGPLLVCYEDGSCVPFELALLPIALNMGCSRPAHSRGTHASFADGVVAALASLPSSIHSGNHNSAAMVVGKGLCRTPPQRPREAMVAVQAARPDWSPAPSCCSSDAGQPVSAKVVPSHRAGPTVAPKAAGAPRMHSPVTVTRSTSSQNCSEAVVQTQTLPTPPPPPPADTDERRPKAAVLVTVLTPPKAVMTPPQADARQVLVPTPPTAALVGSPRQDALRSGNTKSMPSLHVTSSPRLVVLPARQNVPPLPLAAVPMPLSPRLQVRSAQAVSAGSASVHSGSRSGCTVVPTIR